MHKVLLTTGLVCYQKILLLYKTIFSRCIAYLLNKNLIWKFKSIKMTLQKKKQSIALKENVNKSLQYLSGTIWQLFMHVRLCYLYRQIYRSWRLYILKEGFISFKAFQAETFTSIWKFFTKRCRTEKLQVL